MFHIVVLEFIYRVFGRVKYIILIFYIYIIFEFFLFAGHYFTFRWSSHCMLLKIICHYFLEKEGTDRKNKITQNRKKSRPGWGCVMYILNYWTLFPRPCPPMYWPYQHNNNWGSGQSYLGLSKSWTFTNSWNSFSHVLSELLI